GDLGDEEEAVITSEKVRALLEASISESVAVFSLHEAAYPWVDGALDTADLTHAHQPGVVFGIPHDRARSTTIPAGMTRAENDIRRRVHFLAAESVSNGFVDIHHHGAYILTWPEDQFGPGA